MEYRTVAETAKKWGISDRRVRILCQQGAIPHCIKKGRSYRIPSNAIKPTDKRYTYANNIQPEYQAIFMKIDSMKEKLNTLRPFTQGELERLQEEFLLEFTYNTNAIEGNTLTLQETARVLEGLTIAQKPLKEHLEAIGHKDAFLFIQDIARSKTKISESIIKQIHSLVLMDRPEDKGTYRNIPVKIMGAQNEPPQPYLLTIQMEQLIAKLHKTKKHPIEAISLFHLDFEGIHPFIDGNGRTGRLLVNLMLIQYGYPPINIKFTDRQQYYETFHAYYQNQDSTKMVFLLASYLKQKLEQYLHFLL